MTETPTNVTPPPDLTYGYVDGRIILAIGDRSDGGRMPDPVPADGMTVTFTPANTILKVASPTPATVIKQPITCSVDANGYLVDEQGARGVWLVAGVYKVTYSHSRAIIPSHDIEVTTGHTEVAPLDLTTAMPPGGPVLTPSEYAELNGRITILAAQGVKADTAVQPGDLIVNVRDFGATGDGATDDTVAIQAAINSLTPAASSAEFAGAGAGAVYLPPGEYVVTNLTMRANVSIRGAGYRATALIATGTGGYTLDTTGLTNTNRIANVEVSGLTIGPTGGAFGLAGTRPAVGGINLGYSQWCVVRDVFIHNIAGVGLNLTQAFDLNTYNTHIMYTGTTASPAVLMAGDADNTCNANHHFGMRVERCPKMLSVTGATHPPVNNEFIGCKFEWNTAGQPTTTGPAIDIEHAVQLKFSECMFVSDTITYPSVSIGAASGATTQGVRFIGCEWNAPTGRSGWVMTSTARAADVDMIGCHILNAGKGITLDPATRGTFVSNRTYNCTAPVLDGVGLQVVSNRFLETYTDAAGVYAVRVSSNSRVVGNHIQGVVSGQRPDGISTSNNTTVTSNLLDQLVVGISFFGTGAKERSNQFLSVFTPLAGSTVTNSQDQSLTDAEKAALHTHPAVIAQGATQADARTAIGLGTAATTASTAYATATQGTTADGAAQKSANLSDLASASTARTNLGLTDSAVVGALPIPDPGSFYPTDTITAALQLIGGREVYGTGSPEGVVTAAVGTYYTDTAGTNGAWRWQKRSGAGNTGWQVLEGDTGWRNVSALLVNGWTGAAHLRRNGALIDLRVEGIDSAAATSGIFLSLPTGFSMQASVTARGLLYTTALTMRRVFTGIDITVSSYGASDVLYGELISTVYPLAAAPWPTTLPGTAA